VQTGTPALLIDSAAKIWVQNKSNPIRRKFFNIYSEFDAGKFEKKAAIVKTFH